MEEYLKRLSELILFEIGRKNQSCVCFAELCGISRNEMSDIINLKKKDIRLSTIVNICENSDINIENIFASQETGNDKFFNKVTVMINGKYYKMELKEYK